MSDEIWKPIPGFIGLYEASALGRIRSLVKGRILKPSKRKDGYLQVSLSLKGEIKTHYVHRLVAKTFLENGSGDEVNHKNSIRDDNTLSNLELVSTRENRTHGRERKYTGAYKVRKRWHSRIMVNGKRKLLGTHNTAEEASAAYRQALRQANVENKYAQ